MHAFWRDSGPLTAYEANLLDLTLRAHDASARRANISSSTATNAFIGSGSLTQSVAAALLTLGTTHGPIEPAYRYLTGTTPVAEVWRNLRASERIPGFGSGFVKGRPDALWRGVEEALTDRDDEACRRAIETQAVMHNAGKRLYLNAAGYSALVAIALRVPAPIAPWLFVRGRIDVWAELMYGVVR
jgi:citrate synthase